MPRGRPCELTPDVQRKICKALADGNVRDHAARAGGITRTTLFRWIALGRNAKSGKYRDFWNAAQNAEDECARRMMAVVQKSARGFTEKIKKVRVAPDGTTTETTERKCFDAEAAKWWLRVRFPEHYGDHQHQLKDLQKQIKELEALIRGTQPLPPQAVQPEAGGTPPSG